MSDALRLPCKESGDPDDWFIGRDGKQYPDQEFVHIEDVAVHIHDAMPDRDPESVTVDEVDEIMEHLERDAKREALIRRRKARDKCHNECLFRTRCLDLAITTGAAYGTWGGYYEEEVRVLQAEIRRRKL